jgi:hypothetical protein
MRFKVLGYFYTLAPLQIIMLGQNEYEKSDLNVSLTFLDMTMNVTLNAPYLSKY